MTNNFTDPNRITCAPNVSAGYHCSYVGQFYVHGLQDTKQERGVYCM